MKPKNIVFYFSDQQRWDTLGCYGQRLNVSPVLDKLAKEGTLFEYAFTPQPVCGPARACLQTGMFAAEAGVHMNHRRLEPDADTLAKRLNNAGYETAYIGKWHLASCDELSYRTEAVPPKFRGGYQYWMASDTLEWTSHGYNGYVFDGDMRRHDFVGHRIDCINAYAVDYIHKYAQGSRDRPFFMFVSHIDPHHQNDHMRYEGPDGSKRRFADFDVPEDLKGKSGDYTENYPDYLGQCNLLDQNVGKLMDALEDAGLKDDTVFIYTSDHGSHFRTRNSEYKRSCEDSCLRVPMIIWGGEFANGGKVNKLVSLIDLPATILDIAGLEVPRHYRGHSLLNLVNGKSNDWEDAVYAQISEAENARCLRTRRWKYSVTAPEFKIDEAYPAVYVEDKLYDLENDPYENRNLINDAAYEQVRIELMARLKQFMKYAHEPEAEILPRTKLA